MNYQQRILDLQEKLIEGNYMLLQLCNGLNADDKKAFAPKVEKHITESKVLFETKVGESITPDGYPEAPTLYLHEQTNWD